MEWTPIATTLIKSLVEITKARLSKLVRSSPLAEPLDRCLERHLTEVSNWSSRIQFLGMSTPEQTDHSTVSLDLSTEPRKFRSTISPLRQFSEESLLADSNNYILLGDPGAGKTTTLKRLARKLFLEEPSSDEDIYQYPIVIRLRELKAGDSLYTTISRIFGLKVEQRAIEGVKPEEMASFIGKERIEYLIPQALNATNAVLLLDGLDEVPGGFRQLLENEIAAIGYSLAGSKIITSLRSGDYTRSLDGFNSLEICPLTPEQKLSIAEKWTPKAKEFMEALHRTPYSDLADRPLLLTQLLFLFKAYSSLPEQPALVYRRLLKLLLENWDSERKINRPSKYSGFEPDRKMAFLAHLSYHLTYKIRTTSFSRSNLIQAYSSIYRPFNLPEHEAEQVAREIENHTGIIVEAGLDRYEFSHLSLQEFLCAEHLVRDPFPERLENYLSQYPAPLAIAVAVSSNPGDWFAGLILKSTNYGAFTSTSMVSFLSRMLKERPFFDVSIPLGLAIIKLMSDKARWPEPVIASTLLLTDIDSASRSLASSLMMYKIPSDQTALSSNIRIKRRFPYTNPYGFETPESASLPRELLITLIAKFCPEFTWEDEHGHLHPVRVASNSRLLLDRLS